MGSRRRVIKLGGSLLDWPAWPAAFVRWLGNQPPAADALIVGGGARVEQLRRRDRAAPLPQEASHWLAIAAMNCTAASAGRRLQVPVVRALEELPGACGELAILEVESLLRSEARRADALPCGWEVTSDSIAAHVARRLGTDELVLLKSTLPEAALTVSSAAASGYVDAYFPRVARALAVRCVNLRDDACPELVLRGE